jgi:hypothetical protein
MVHLANRKSKDKLCKKERRATDEARCCNDIDENKGDGDSLLVFIIYKTLPLLAFVMFGFTVEALSPKKGN